MKSSNHFLLVSSGTAGDFDFDEAGDIEQWIRFRLVSGSQTSPGKRSGLKALTPSFLRSSLPAGYDELTCC
jgi:hypothetical protein